MAQKSRSDNVRQYVKDAYCDKASRYVKYRLGKCAHVEDSLVPLVRDALRELGSASATILDLGCGFDPMMSEIPYRRYIGIDISEELIKRHPLYGHPNAEFHRKDVRLCRLDRFDCDIVNGTLILNYIKTPAKVLAKVRMKGRGFCFSVPNPAFDQRHGELNGDDTIELVVNRHRFVYYLHTLRSLKVALGRTAKLKIGYTREIAEGIPPVYACVWGRW